MGSDLVNPDPGLRCFNAWPLRWIYVGNNYREVIQYFSRVLHLGVHYHKIHTDITLPPNLPDHLGDVLVSLLDQTNRPDDKSRLNQVGDYFK